MRGKISTVVLRKLAVGMCGGIILSLLGLALGVKFPSWLADFFYTLAGMLAGIAIAITE